MLIICLISCCREAGQEHSLIKVGFVTYNSQLHFYNVKVVKLFSLHVHCLFYMLLYVSGTLGASQSQVVQLCLLLRGPSSWDW